MGIGGNAAHLDIRCLQLSHMHQKGLETLPESDPF